jgi:hypothetical protein
MALPLSYPQHAMVYLYCSPMNVDKRIALLWVGNSIASDNAGYGPSLILVET